MRVMQNALAERRAQIASFQFHHVHPNVQFGTASDRYAGWIGQIYPPEYEALVTTRSKTLEDRSYEERMLPVESVREYFRHFSVLELDFTFYRPLLEPDGGPSSSLTVLQQYVEHAPEDALFLLKAPQTFCARKLRRATAGQARHEDNPNFLNATGYVEQFLEPAFETLAERLQGVIFEQEYQRVQDSPSTEENVSALDAFFSAVPDEIQSHLEIRSPHLLTRPYFDWLESRGLGFVFSHWTWLPPIREQWKLCEGRFTAGDGNVVARLLTPLGTTHAEAYAQTHPFDKPVEHIAGSQEARSMILGATALALQAERQGAILNLIANNPAYGNAPALHQAIASRILDEEEKRG